MEFDDVEKAIAEEDELECRRLRYLRDKGLLREDELELVTERGCDE